MTKEQRRRLAHRAYQRKYRQNNLDRVKEIERASHIRCRSINAGKKLELQRLRNIRYRQKHRDEIRERAKAHQKEYRQKYPDRVSFRRWSCHGGVKLALLDPVSRRAFESAYQRKLSAKNALRQIKTLQQNKENNR